MSYLLGFGIVALVIVVYLIATYNQFVTLRNRIRASIQEIGNQLKRQADLIPNLQESAKAFLKQEKGIFDALTAARKSVTQALESQDVAQMTQASDLMGKALEGLRVVVESNPEIKSNEVITNLMNELRDTADKVMYSRRTLIDLTADYNIMRETFPSSIVASLFGMKEEKGLEMPADTQNATSVNSSDLKTPKVDLS